MGKRYGSRYTPTGKEAMPTSVAPYRQPEELRRTPIAGGGEIILEALSPLFGSGPPLVRHVAEFKVDGGVHTVESYLQVPYVGFTELGEQAEDIIQADAARLERLIARRRGRKRAAGVPADTDMDTTLGFNSDGPRNALP